jgi:putative hemolysin
MKALEQLEVISAARVSIDAGNYPFFKHTIPNWEIREEKYCVRFARTPAELDRVLKLRFEVFNLELGEGLESSFRINRDLDEFDETCHHLIVEDVSTDRIVGTYRMQTADMAAAGFGWYSATEFDLMSLPITVIEDSVELGRACVARDHRNLQVLFLLWRGLAAYVAHNKKRYLFGCCSLTSQDARDGLRLMQLLEAEGNCNEVLQVTPKPGFECAINSEDDTEPFDISAPRLFQIYLRYGAKVCGPPALDRRFKTIDFLVMFDVFEMDGPTRKLFFGA